jgi:hypothetical protein
MRDEYMAHRDTLLTNIHIFQLLLCDKLWTKILMVLVKHKEQGLVSFVAKIRLRLSMFSFFF